jgi:DmsE family decaheme c-type cytochrome
MSPRAVLAAAVLLLVPPLAARGAPADAPAQKKGTKAAPSKAPAGTAAPAPASNVEVMRSAPKQLLFKLRPGANGEVCLECHADFAQRLSKPSVHTPVKDRDCAGCHNPHASANDRLLIAAPKELCATCHGDVVPSGAKSVHKPVGEKRCTDCHDPHASGFKKNLVRGGTELCAGCHPAITDAASRAQHKHKPVEESCLRCHDPHGSAAGPSLLVADVPGLCLKCHNVDAPIIAKKHMGYPVKQARCTTCHDPHGSPAPGLLYSTVHPPVARGQCSMCHEPATSKTPLKTRQLGVTLCKTCHAARIAQFLDKNRVHQPISEGQCLACHGPHASKQKGIVKANMVITCGACHSDTIRRQDLSPTKHKPIAEGQCTACHDPHSGSAPLMLVNADRIDLCGGCHDWQKHATHPIGPNRKDPRNRNLSLDCSSCHRAHGTGAKHLIPYAKVTDLCTNCHEQFKR